MATNTIKNLRDTLDNGLGIFSRIWEFKAKNWITSVRAADIDGDGDIEIIFSSREGRVYCLSKTGKLRWKRVIGARVWIGTIVVSSSSSQDKETNARIIVGTRDGKVYVLDKDGRTITRDGRTLLVDEEGQAIDAEEELQAHWFNKGYVVRGVAVDPLLQSQIIIGTEDRCAYGLDAKTGKELWYFKTDGWVRAVFSYDINGDKQDEILVGSADGYLYVLDLNGRLLAKHSFDSPIQTIFATDVDQDGIVEILITSNSKNLVALVYHQHQEKKVATPDHLEEKWEICIFEKSFAHSLCD